MEDANTAKKNKSTSMEQLQIESQRLINEERRTSIENSKANRLSNKIEHARRNVEMLSKVSSDNTEAKKLISELVIISLNAMKEIENIK